jgi:nitroreductase
MAADIGAGAGRGGIPHERGDQLPHFIAHLLRAAVAAPSMHNTQPWRFRYRAERRTIELYADPERALQHSDQHGRSVHIGCGAALFNLRLAAAWMGREPIVRLLPRPEDPLLLATVRLAGPHRPRTSERELYLAIPRRHTSRQPFTNRAVPGAVLAELAEAARIEGAVLHLLHPGEAQRVLRLAADAEHIQLADPGYRAELAAWAGGSRDRDGIADASMGPRPGNRFPDGPLPTRDFGPALPPGKVRYAVFEREPRIAVLSTQFRARADWLSAGQALQRVLLLATARGVSAQPLTQPLEVPDAWLVRDPRAGIEQPQMILRLGYGPVVPQSPRRPISEVLDEPQAS